MLTFLLGSKYQTYLLDAALDEFFKQYQDDRPHHAVGTGNGEEILLECPGGRIETGAETCHGNDGLTDGMDRLQRERISLHVVGIQIVGKLLLGFLTPGQELHGAVAMRAYTLSAPYQRLDIGILQDGMKLGRMQG